MTTIGKTTEAIVYMDVYPEKRGGYSVIARNWPGVQTQGETLEECLYMAKDVVKLMFEVHKERGGSLPSPTMPPLPKGATHTFVLELVS